MTHGTNTFEELRTVATEVKRSRKQDAVGASWEAILVEEDPQWRGIRTLLVEAEVERGGGRGGKRGEATEGGG